MDKLLLSLPYEQKKSSSDLLDIYKKSAQDLVASWNKYAQEREKYDSIINRTISEPTSVENLHIEPLDPGKTLNSNNNSSNVHSLDANYQHINFIRHVISNGSKEVHSRHNLKENADIEEINWRDQASEYAPTKIDLAASENFNKMTSGQLS